MVGAKKANNPISAWWMRTFFGRSSIGALIFWAAVLRLVVLCYGAFHDATFRVKYTDIDYNVITDGAAEMVKGNSPFARATFRYTPLLSLLMIPNVLLWHHAGKILFCCCDLLVGFFAFRILRQSLLSSTASSGKDKKDEGSTHQLVDVIAKVLVSAFVLFNPVIVNVSTRGNADMLVTCLTIGVLYFFYTEQLLVASIILGFAVHVKIYPIIYAAPLVFGLLHKQLHSAAGKSNSGWFFSWVAKCVTCGVFTVIAFAVPTYLCGLAYGGEYYYEALTYHFGRVDHRHNLSPYFYPAYLNMAPNAREPLSSFAYYFQYDPNAPSQLGTPVEGHKFPGNAQGYGWLVKMAFFPQFFALLFVSYRLRKNIAHAFCIETLLFVAYNKVCTVQYFAWFIPFIPFILGDLLRIFSAPVPPPHSGSGTIGKHMAKLKKFTSRKVVVFVVGLWILALGGWMLIAKQVEFDGKAHFFFPLWVASCCFFIAQMVLVMWLSVIAAIVQNEQLAVSSSRTD